MNLPLYVNFLLTPKPHFSTLFLKAAYCHHHPYKTTHIRLSITMKYELRRRCICYGVSALYGGPDRSKSEIRRIEKWQLR